MMSRHTTGTDLPALVQAAPPARRAAGTASLCAAARALPLAALCTVACAFDGSAYDLAASPQPDAGALDEIDSGIDAAPLDSDAAPLARRHLLITEVKITGDGTEFVEIYNPTEQSISLADHYLADDADYALLPGAFGSGPRPATINSDFIARFPSDATIASGQALLVGIDPGEFGDTFGLTPDYKVGNSGSGTDMLEAFPSSIGALVSLTDSGEGIALFTWDGQSDLVTDVDLVNAGNDTSTANALATKTAVFVDGPDPGAAVSTYRKDLATMGTLPPITARSQSYARTAPEAGNETQAGTGNGEYGHDETSEDTTATWQVLEAATPGIVPAGL